MFQTLSSSVALLAEKWFRLITSRHKNQAERKELRLIHIFIVADLPNSQKCESEELHSVSAYICHQERPPRLFKKKSVPVANMLEERFPYGKFRWVRVTGWVKLSSNISPNLALPSYQMLLGSNTSAWLKKVESSAERCVHIEGWT